VGGEVAGEEGGIGIECSLLKTRHPRVGGSAREDVYRGGSEGRFYQCRSHPSGLVAVSLCVRASPSGEGGEAAMPSIAGPAVSFHVFRWLAPPSSWPDLHHRPAKP
jgi:hypothetical protein